MVMLDAMIVDFVEVVAFVAEYHVQGSVAEKGSCFLEVISQMCVRGSQMLELFTSNTSCSLVVGGLAENSRVLSMFDPDIVFEADDFLIRKGTHKIDPAIRDVTHDRWRVNEHHATHDVWIVSQDLARKHSAVRMPDK